MANDQRTDRFTSVEDQYAGYTVRDPNGEKIGKVDDLFLDENDQPEYIGVKMGFFGTRSTLIPMDIATVDQSQGFIEVNQPKSQVKDGPAFEGDQEITPEYENEVRSYYGLGTAAGNGDRGTYGDYHGDGETGRTGAAGEERRESEESTGHSGSGTTGSETAGTAGAGMSMGDTESGEFREHDRNVEGVNQPGSDLEDEDELRVQRSEEELRAGTREREAGSVKVRKRVRTERERLEVPVRREEVSVERVPLSGEATEAEIGEGEVSMPVTEEEVVTDKRAVAKEEIRVRKDAVQDTEVVEEDVRKEEVDVEDATEQGRRDTER